MYIENNPLLTYCDLPNICTYLTGGGFRSIFGNSGDCEDEMAVQKACQPQAVSVETLDSITVECPAPFSGLPLPDSVTVTYDDERTSRVAVTWQQGSYPSTTGSYTLTGIPDLTGDENPDELTAGVHVNVEDTQAPIPDVATLRELRGGCSVTVSTLPTATDNCAGGITATSEDPLVYDEPGSYTVTWSYDDGQGNQVTQDQTVIVETPLAPVIECGETDIVSCEAEVTFDLPVAVGECGSVRVVQTDGTGLTPGSVFPVGTTVLTYRASTAGGSATCTIKVEVLPELDIRHVSGVQNGDTLHIADCLPPDLLKDDLDLGRHQYGSTFRGRIFREDLPDSTTAFGLWKLLSYEYEVTGRCGGTEDFQNYVALYDLAPPVFRNFPEDDTIASVEDLPAVSGEVEILDICRFVVWDTVITTPVTDPESKDTLAYVRRWMAEDEVGNRSFRDQMIYIAQVSAEAVGGLTAHVAKEFDLIRARFPGGGGTDGIPVALYRVDTVAEITKVVDTAISGNWQMGATAWQAQKGKIYFTPLFPGLYRVKVEVPEGYVATDADSLFQLDGWSDTLMVADGSPVDVGTILFIPTPVTPAVDTVWPLVTSSLAAGMDMDTKEADFTVYPNPTMGTVRIDLPDYGIYPYTVYNHLGRLVQKGQIENGSAIDLNNLAAGMYFIRVESAGQFLGTKRIALFVNE